MAGKTKKQKNEEKEKMENRKNLKKMIACGLSLICVVTAGIAAAVKLGQKPGESNRLEASLPDNGGAELEAGENHGIRLAAVKLASSQYSEYGVSAQAETAYTLTATVYPEDAANKSVDWSIAFKNASSSWASGKTVTDYATVTPTSDGALTAVVENIEAFGEQIVVTARSRDNTDAYATCTVEYLQRTTGYVVFFNLVQYSTYGMQTINVKPTFAEANSATVTLSVPKSSVYTRANTDKAEYFTIKPTEAFKTAITNAGFTASSMKEYTGTGTKQVTLTDFLDEAWGAALYGSDNERKNALIAAIGNYSGTAYELSVYDTEGGTQLATFDITLDASLLTGQKGVESIELDEAEIVF